jgi:hypothetical protein
MAIAHGLLQQYLDKNGRAYTEASTAVTLTGNLSHQELLEVIRAAELSGYRFVIESGVPKLKQK